MRVATRLVVLLPLLALGSTRAPSAEQAITCADLSVAAWGGFRVDRSEERAAADGQPAHCFVAGTIDDEIHFELLMPPPERWNGRFVMGGGGGFVGSVQNHALAYAPTLLADGFATVGTDTGHTSASGVDGSWALDRVDREVNFGHRAVHLTAEAAKTIMRLHYGDDIAYSYWMGCSRGGGQGLVEAQRYPDDFDGMVVGSPALDWPAMAVQFIQTQRAMYPDPARLTQPVVTPEALALLNAAIMDACDELDGLADGILNDPRECHFDPASLRCDDGRSTGCLTDAQVAALEVVYRGAEVGGRTIWPGFALGGEIDPGGWDSWITGGAATGAPADMPSAHYAFGTEFFKYLVYDDPSWDYATYDFARWEADSRRIGALLNATDEDLTSFDVGGGKLLLWVGWSDPALSPYATIDYFEGIESDASDPDSFARLFLLPGVDHCLGGPGPSAVDWLGAIQRWVEEGEAPDRLTAMRFGDQGIEMARPICAYPAKAEYIDGDPSREESFECR